jgi:Glyoxalase-like domain
MTSVKQIQVTFDCAEPERVARFWCEVLGYVLPPPPEGFATWDDFDRALPPAHQGSAFALIPQVWVRDCSSSAFPKARLSRIGCILTCGSAPGSWAKSAWPHLMPNAHDWSRWARHACDYCLLTEATSRAS